MSSHLTPAPWPDRAWQTVARPGTSAEPGKHERDLAWHRLPGSPVVGVGQPNGGYLLRLAIEAARPLTDDGHQVRSATLRVRRQARLAAFTSLASTAPGTAGLGRITVSFDQDGAFADADLTTGPSHGSTAEADALPPPARPTAYYMPMLMRPRSPPPFTVQFRHRPVVGPDGTGPRPGWEAVWVSPSPQNQIRGTPLITSLVDCWYPASLLRTAQWVLSEIRAGTGGPVTEPPPPMVLASAHLSFAHSIGTAPGDRLRREAAMVAAPPSSSAPSSTATTSSATRSGPPAAGSSPPGDILRRTRPTTLMPYGGYNYRPCLTAGRPGPSEGATICLRTSRHSCRWDRDLRGRARAPALGGHGPSAAGLLRHQMGHAGH